MRGPQRPLPRLGGRAGVPRRSSVCGPGGGGAHCYGGAGPLRSQSQIVWTSFTVPVDGGDLRGHRGGGGGAGPFLPGCAELLGDLFEIIRYTQRGVSPSEVGPPYSIESHVGDAVAVLDSLGVERAWVMGHSWGGHLAIHLAVAHPERLVGLICIDPLGARSEVLAEFTENQRRGLTPEQADRIDEVEELRWRGEATEDDLLERWRLIWPLFFSDPSLASEPPNRVSVECSRWTNASIAEHFERGTLVTGLPSLRLPALFIHGEDDPLPPRTSFETAELIPGAVVETIPDSGHFPWLEKPREVRAAVESFLASLD